MPIYDKIHHITIYTHRNIIMQKILTSMAILILTAPTLQSATITIDSSNSPYTSDITAGNIGNINATGSTSGISVTGTGTAAATQGLANNVGGTMNNTTIYGTGTGANQGFVVNSGGGTMNNTTITFGGQLTAKARSIIDGGSLNTGGTLVFDNTSNSAINRSTLRNFTIADGTITTNAANYYNFENLLITKTAKTTILNTNIIGNNIQVINNSATHSDDNNYRLEMSTAGALEADGLLLHSARINNATRFALTNVTVDQNDQNARASLLISGTTKINTLENLTIMANDFYPVGTYNIDFLMSGITGSTLTNANVTGASIRFIAQNDVVLTGLNFDAQESKIQFKNNTVVSNSTFVIFNSTSGERFDLNDNATLRDSSISGTGELWANSNSKVLNTELSGIRFQLNGSTSIAQGITFNNGASVYFGTVGSVLKDVTVNSGSFVELANAANSLTGTNVFNSGSYLNIISNVTTNYLLTDSGSSLELNGAKIFITAGTTYQHNIRNVTINNLSGNGTLDLAISGANSDQIDLKYIMQGNLSGDYVFTYSGDLASNLLNADILDVSGATVSNATFSFFDTVNGYQYLLRENPNSPGVFQIYQAGIADSVYNVAAMRSALLAYTRSLNNALHKRSGEIQEMVHNIKSDENDNHKHYHSSKRNSLWARPVAGIGNVSDNQNTDIQFYGFELGYDHDIWSGKTFDIFLGGLYGYNNGKFDFDQHFDFNTASAKIDTQYTGIYLTYLSDNGFYVDTTVRYYWFDYDMTNTSPSVDTMETGKTDAVSASLEAGKQISLGIFGNKEYFIQPRTELTFTKINAESGLNAIIDTTKSLVGDLGLMIGWRDFGYNENVFEPYLWLGYKYEFMGKTDVTNSGIQMISDLNGGALNTGIGITAQLSNSIRIYGHINYDYSSEYDMLNGSIGLRYQF